MTLRRSLSAALALAALLTPLSGAWSQPASSDEVMLAVVRADLLQPVARFDGRAWDGPGPVSRWPREWLRWPPSGGAATRVSATVRPPDSRCAVATMALDVPSRGTRPGDEVAMATSAPARVRAVRPVTRESGAWQAARAALAPLFERAARRNGLSLPLVARITPVIDAMFESASQGTPMYYVETSKRLPDAGGTPQEDPKGVVRLAITGWFRSEGPQLVPAATKAELHWEPADDRGASAAPALSPLAVLPDEARDLWLMKSAAGERTSYVLYAVSRNAVRVLVSTDVPAC